MISWIFTTFTGSTTTTSKIRSNITTLWLAEFLLPLQGQQQLLWKKVWKACVVISWIFTTFTGSTTTRSHSCTFPFVLWLAEFLLPLQGQQQRLDALFIDVRVVISWIFTTFTGSTTTLLSRFCVSSSLWLAEFLLPLQGQQQPFSTLFWKTYSCD